MYLIKKFPSTNIQTFQISSREILTLFTVTGLCFRLVCVWKGKYLEFLQMRNKVMTRFGLARKHLEEEVFIHFIRRSFKTISEIRLGYRQSASLLTFKLQVCIAPIQTEKILVDNLEATVLNMPKSCNLWCTKTYTSFGLINLFSKHILYNQIFNPPPK